MKKILHILPVVILLMAFDCPPTGNATDEKDKVLNFLKNRTAAPSNNELDRVIALEDMMNSKDAESIFDDKKGVSVMGYVYGVEQGKGDSTNCNSTNPNDWTTTLFIAKDGKARRISECVVAAVTPASRKLHPDWTLKYLKSIQGKRVRLSGWLLFNYPAIKNSAGSNPFGAKLQMATAWQVYPVTFLRVDE